MSLIDAEILFALNVQIKMFIYVITLELEYFQRKIYWNVYVTDVIIVGEKNQAMKNKASIGSKSPAVIEREMKG